MHISLPENVPASKGSLFVVKIEVPAASRGECIVEVAVEGPLQPLDLQGVGPGGRYGLPQGVEALHVPIRVETSQPANAVVHFRVTDHTGAQETQQHSVNLDVASAPAKGGSKAGLVFVLLLGMAGLGIWLGPKFFRRDYVPDVRGMTYDKALADLTTAGYRAKQWPDIVQDKAKHGVVLRTKPRGGEPYDTKNEVAVFVGEMRVEMMHLVGQSEAAAERSLQEDGLAPYLVFREVDDESKVGKVLSQSANAGDQVPVGTSIELVIGKDKWSAPGPVEPPIPPTPGPDEPKPEPPTPVPGPDEPKPEPPTPVPGPDEPKPEPPTPVPGPDEPKPEPPTPVPGPDEPKPEPPTPVPGPDEPKPEPPTPVPGPDEPKPEPPTPVPGPDEPKPEPPTPVPGPDEPKPEPPTPVPGPDEPKPEPPTPVPGPDEPKPEPPTPVPGPDEPKPEPPTPVPGPDEPKPEPPTPVPGPDEPKPEPPTPVPGPDEPKPVPPTPVPGPDEPKPEPPLPVPGPDEPKPEPPTPVPGPDEPTPEPPVPGPDEPKPEPPTLVPGPDEPRPEPPPPTPGPTAPSGSEIIVPDVIGMTRDLGETAIRRAGLRYRTKLEVTDDAPDGQILTQSPSAGEVVGKRTRITIIVARRPATKTVATVRVPDVTGLARKDAETTLREAGFLVRLSYEPREEALRGVVCRQSPDAGTAAKPRTWVEIVVGIGR